MKDLTRYMKSNNKKQRKGNWMQTYTGLQFWSLDPRVEDVCIEV